MKEIPLKSWRLSESQRLGLTPSAIASRLARGQYRGLKLRRVNRRVVFVRAATDNSLTQVIETILRRMYRRRIDQYNEPLTTWRQVRRTDDKRPPREIIRQLLSEEKRVTAGYFTTGVRGYHEHVIYWRL